MLAWLRRSRAPAGGQPLRRAALVLVCALALSASVTAQADAQLVPPADPPRLFVVVVIDQCRTEYLDRFAPLLPKGGFRRLLAEGAFFPDAAHAHTVTSTGPGHAAIATGCLPARAGIPENEFMEGGVTRYCVADDDATLVASLPGVRPASVSARMLQRPTLGDLLKARHGDGARVVSIGWKDRAALLMGGSRSDGTYWIESANGSWVTTSALRPALPDWVTAINARGELAAASGTLWERTLDEQRAEAFSGPDDAPGETAAAGTRPVFPHRMPTAETAARGGSLRSLCRVLGGTPTADLAVLAAARSAIEHDSLGADDVPDVLFLAFAALDYAGHDYGPRSQEVLEVFLALDRRLAELMELLDERVGAGRWTLALSADHGLGELPEQSGALRLTQEELRDQLEAALVSRLGVPGAARDAAPGAPSDPAPHAAPEVAPAGAPGDSPDGAPAPRRWIAAVMKPSVWLDAESCAAAGRSVSDVAKIAAEELAALPGIERAATRAQLAAAADDSAAHPDLSDLARDVHPTRSGDLLFLVTRGTLLARGVAADHGSHHPEDRAVPLLFSGAGIAPGSTPGRAAPMDIAPTLAQLARVEAAELADMDGRVLQAALAAPVEPPATPTPEPAADSGGR